MQFAESLPVGKDVKFSTKIIAPGKQDGITDNGDHTGGNKYKERLDDTSKTRTSLARGKLVFSSRWSHEIRFLMLLQIQSISASQLWEQRAESAFDSYIQKLERVSYSRANLPRNVISEWRAK